MVYRTALFSITLNDPMAHTHVDFKVRLFFDAEYLRNGYTATYHGRRIGNPKLSNGTIFNDLE